MNSAYARRPLHGNAVTKLQTHAYCVRTYTLACTYAQKTHTHTNTHVRMPVQTQTHTYTHVTKHTKAYNKLCCGVKLML